MDKDKIYILEIFKKLTKNITYQYKFLSTLNNTFCLEKYLNTIYFIALTRLYIS